jgi:GT2 family glycosyltransferase
VRVRVVCATRADRERFFASTALGRSLSVHRPAAVELRLFASNAAGLPAVYNTAIDEAAEEPAILLFVHDDVHLCDFHWADGLNQALEQFAVVGVAGNRRRVARQPGWLFVDERFTLDARENLSGTVAHGRGFPPDRVDVFGPSRQRVSLLDGVALAVSSATLQAKGLRFDERFDFHFYDMDFCRQAEQADLAMGTWPVSLVHESGGAFGGDGWQRGYLKYLEKWRE